MNIYYDRLKTCWESDGFTDANEFAKSLGWPRAEKILRLNREGNESVKPGIDILIDIAAVYPDFNFIFLLTGNRADFKSALRSENSGSDEDDKNRPCNNAECLEEIKKLNDQIKNLEDQLKDKSELLEFYRKKKETGYEGGSPESEGTNRSKAS